MQPGKKTETVMLFSENRYDLYGACDPISGMRSILEPDPKLWVLIIPDIGSLCRFVANHQHIGFQKKT
jgi:hypothetical protein